MTESFIEYLNRKNPNLISDLKHEVAKCSDQHCRGIAARLFYNNPDKEHDYQFTLVCDNPDHIEYAAKVFDNEFEW